jgi:hypothetical protein
MNDALYVVRAQCIQHVGHLMRQKQLQSFQPFYVDTVS